MLMLPSVRPEDAGTYVCTATNRQGKVKAFAYLQVPGRTTPALIGSTRQLAHGGFSDSLLSAERVVPYFTQTPYSFLPLPTIKDAYRKFEIKITFRPDSADGEQAPHGSGRLAWGRVGACLLDLSSQYEPRQKLLSCPEPHWVSLASLLFPILLWHSGLHLLLLHGCFDAQPFLVHLPDLFKVLFNLMDLIHSLPLH